MLFNHILYIDKPVGITSYDVCHKLKKILNISAIGHTGTLDPNASGVMVILLNKACKLNQFLVKHNKTYEGEVKIGIKTDTLDIDGKIIEKSSDRINDFKIFKESTNTMIGKQLQTPPMTSAVKIKGKKLLEYQKENIDVEVPSRDIEVFEFVVFDIKEDSFKFKTTVSSGTYIRVLIEDYLKKFNLIGTLIKLNRTKLGDVCLEECQKLSDIEKNAIAHDPYKIMCSTFKTIEIEEPLKIIQGKIFEYNGIEDEILLVNDGRLLAVYRRDKGNIYKCVRGLF